MIRITDFIKVNETSLEDVNPTKQEAETELVIYAKINNIDGLSKANDMEEQEQVTGELKNANRVRVRKTTKGDETSYVLTIKSSDSDTHEDFETMLEYNVEVDEVFYEAFKKIADTLLIKTRYIFSDRTVSLTIKASDGEDQVISIPGVKYEVDVFRDKDDNIIQWCKIDVEVDVILNFLESKHPDIEDVKLKIGISHLPFEPREAILDLDASEEERVFISDLWTKYDQEPTIVESSDE